MVLSRLSATVAWVVLCLLVSRVRAFYIPGVAPTEYADGDKLEIKVCYTCSWERDDFSNKCTVHIICGCVLVLSRPSPSLPSPPLPPSPLPLLLLPPSLPPSLSQAVKMTSIKTQLPFEYYSLSYCKPKGGDVHYKTLNLGTVHYQPQWYL